MAAESAQADQTTWVIRDGHGTEMIEAFTPRTDVLAFDMNEILSFKDVRDRMKQTAEGTVITFDNGDELILRDIRMKALKAANFSFTTGPVCVLQGTKFLTDRGQIAIEHLRPDDIIWTKDNGWQALRLVVMETMVFKDREDPAKPILIPSGALGANQPETDLVLSPLQRVLRIVEETGEEVLVPAGKLVGLNGIRKMRGKKRAHYLNVVMERHSVIQAAGCWVESLLVTSGCLSRQSQAARRLLDHSKGMTPARRVEQKGVRPRRLKSA